MVDCSLSKMTVTAFSFFSLFFFFVMGDVRCDIHHPSMPTVFLEVYTMFQTYLSFVYLVPSEVLGVLLLSTTKKITN